MSETGIYILSLGMTCSVGVQSMQTFASVRSGISRFGETSVYDKRFNPFVMALLPDDVLPPLEPSIAQVMGLSARQKRMLQLATFALDEVLQDISFAGEIPLLLGVPEPMPGRFSPAGDHFIELLCRQTGKRLNADKSKLIAEGQASGLAALKAALDLINAGEAQQVLVGGVDTLLDLYTLGMLDSEGRILSPTTMDGFIPGEGAAFLLLGKSQNVGGKTFNPCARVLAASTGFEQGHRYSDEPYKGDGLSQTFAGIFENSVLKSKVKTVYAGLNGESFNAKEWGVAYLRHKDSFEENHRYEHPADCMGDTGAALGVLMAGLASIGLAKNTIDGPCLIWGSSDYGQRAAVVIDKV